jgi:hypothetical protein
MQFVFVYFFNFSEMLHYIAIKRVYTPVHNCDIGGHFCTRRDDHVILCSTFEFLFGFQNRIFLEIFVRFSNCSNYKPKFEGPL